jgi:EAL domain-containing protein (putative c-di-GMP-specific phosphodiesterase class I)
METRNQAIRLKDLGCKYGQGYVFSQPVDASSAEGLLESGFVTGAA